MVNVGYRFQQDILKQYDVSFAWPIASHWNTVGRYVYSIQDRQVIEQLAGFEYKSCCWRIQVLQRRYLTNRTGGLRHLDCFTIGTDGLCARSESGRTRSCPKEISGYSTREPRRAAVNGLPNRKIYAKPSGPLRTPHGGSAGRLPRARAQTRDIGAHGELLDRIAAIVNDGLVLKSELDEQMEAVTKRLQEQKVELPPENVLRQQVLERLILQEIELSGPSTSA